MSDVNPAGDRAACGMPGFVVLYRWRLHPGSEEIFVAAWRRVSAVLRTRGSLGARLHKGSDGLWYSYAQWPTATCRERAFSEGPADALASKQMQSAIAEYFPEMVLEPIADLTVTR